MATSDVQNLYERYLQILGGPSSSPEPSQSEPRAQFQRSAYALPSEACQVDGGYSPTGGVLGGLASPSPGIPWWGQALSPPGGAAVGPRGLSAASRLGRWGGFQMPTDQNNVVEIPNPHLERFIPQSTRDFWNALTLTQQFFRGQWLGDGPSSGDTEAENGASSTEFPSEPPTNRPGSQPPWIVGPAVLKEELERQGRTSNQDQRPNDLVQRPKEIVDPNFRRLTRFLGSEGDQIVSENSVQTTGEEKPRRPPGTPLPDDHLDIPEFLWRQPEPEPAKPEKKWSDLPSASFRGGGNYGGNRGGGGGGGRKSNEECRKEWERAHEICREAFANGTIGDIFKRWKSNYATGPFQKPNAEPWDVNDCKPGFVSEDCGGKEYERAPSPEETKEIGRQLVKQEKAKRAKEKAERKKILEEFQRTGKWRFRG